MPKLFKMMQYMHNASGSKVHIMKKNFLSFEMPNSRLFWSIHIYDFAKNSSENI
jgi:hypothetical protein